MSSFILISALLVAAEPWPRHAIDDTSRGADGVRLADVNGDGLPDIATGWEEGRAVRAYVNPGPKKAIAPWPKVTVGEVRSPEDAVFADLDSDGAMDVVSSCEGGTRTVFVHWAPPDAQRYLDESAWTTAAIPVTEAKQMWMFALPMQIDGQHGVDLIVGSKGSGATIGWLQSPRDARDLAAWEFHPLYKAGWIMSLQAHDMDGDGDLDVLASDRKGSARSVLWLENPGSQAALAGGTWKQHALDKGRGQYMFLTAGTLSGEGGRGLDVLCALNPNSILWIDAKSDLHQITLPAGCGTSKGVAIGDIDLDGATDVVFSCENAGGEKSGVRWLSRDKKGTSWTDHEISGAAGVKFDRLELLDLDADGDLDVLTCEERDNLGVIWYENPTRGPNTGG